jgi:signal transduction histidine kinase
VSPEVAALRLPIGEGLSGRAALTGRPIYSPDLDGDARVDTKVRRTGSNQGMRSYFAVPVIASGEVVGVLQVDSTEPDAFSDSERALMASMAPLIGSAIQNARSYVASLEAEAHFEDIDRMRSDFISIVSHELRTPLTALLGFAELVWQSDADDDSADDLVERIESATARLSHLVDELAKLAGLDAGVLELTVRSVDLALLVESVAIHISADHPVVVDVEQALPRVMADPHRLSDALDALLDNAAKFSETGAPITISVHRRGDAVEIAVVDQGAGVPPEQAEKVFQRFAQAEEPLVRRVGGLGLGLPVARALVERMGGALDLVPGPAGRFVIRLLLEHP